MILKILMLSRVPSLGLWKISFHFFIYLGTVARQSMRTAFQGAVAQTFPVYDLILLLKVARDGACLTSSSRLFQSLGPQKDIALCPLLVFRKGIERSVSVFLSSLTFQVDLCSNKLERYSGTRPFSDLYTVVAVSPLMVSLTEGHFKLCIKPIEGVSKLLFVTILAARFCNFCKVCSLVTPQHPHTEPRSTPIKLPEVPCNQFRIRSHDASTF